MKIETKYELGEHIWYTYIHNDEIHVSDDYITEICIDNDGTEYWCKKAGDNLREDELVKYEDDIGLINRIKELMNTINK